MPQRGQERQRLQHVQETGHQKGLRALRDRNVCEPREVGGEEGGNGSKEREMPPRPKS